MPPDVGCPPTTATSARSVPVNRRGSNADREATRAGLGKYIFACPSQEYSRTLSCLPPFIAMVKIPSPLTVAGPVGRPASACAISPTSSSFSRIDVPLGFFTQNAAAEASVQLMESLPPTMAGVTVGAATRRLSKIHPLSAAAKLREASKRLREMEMAMGKADEGYEFRPWIAMFDHLPRVVSKPRLARGPYTPAVRLSCQSQIMRPSLVLQVQEKIQKEIGALSTRVADDHPVDLGQIMRDLGDLERLDSLKGTAPKCELLRSPARRLTSDSSLDRSWERGEGRAAMPLPSLPPQGGQRRQGRA